ASGDALRVRDPHHDHLGPRRGAPGDPPAVRRQATSCAEGRRQGSLGSRGQFRHALLQLCNAGVTICSLFSPGHFSPLDLFFFVFPGDDFFRFRKGREFPGTFSGERPISVSTPSGLALKQSDMYKTCGMCSAAIACLETSGRVVLVEIGM
ncbi:unnamed protein product, partial [Ectocarpus sp. 12 AP-2014]